MDLPFFSLIGFFFGIILYKTSSQIDDAFRFWLFVAVTTITSMILHGYGQLASILAMNHDHQVSHTNAFFLYFFGCLLNVYIIPLNEVPKWLSSFSLLSTWNLLYELQLYLIYGFGRCPDGLTPKLLWRYDIDDRDKFYLNLYLLIAHFVGIRLVNLTILLIMTNKKK